MRRNDHVSRADGLPKNVTSKEPVEKRSRARERELYRKMACKEGFTETTHLYLKKENNITIPTLLL